MLYKPYLSTHRMTIGHMPYPEIHAVIYHDYSVSLILIAQFHVLTILKIGLR